MAALQDEVHLRVGTRAAPLRPHHTFARAAEVWLGKLDVQVAEGARTERAVSHRTGAPAKGSPRGWGWMWDAAFGDPSGQA